ncbi:hypothetical protein [Bacteriovorax sp. DB6_IX]|uniref:hypothetical protein n=1 Tax=Bacteriovorax sp. DB6_IX TaxID=1353530 RepID=UPI00038A3F02|nr:hypothetical protein [Bacteriovorax sp. DB6_IX]EQC49635.1 hypothetical protein M901_2650 [Bacteriovorax sp. DB6_IX]
MSELLLLERVVVESIAKGNFRIENIQNDTGLDYSFLLSICSRLIKRGLITYKLGEYKISKDEESWGKVNHPLILKNEIKEVSENIIDVFFNDKVTNSLKLQKVYLSDKDEKILNSLLDSVESFVKDLRNSPQNKAMSTKKQKVLMWGYGQYSDIIQNTLKVVS